MRNRIIAAVITLFAIGGVTTPAVMAATSSPPVAAAPQVIFWE